MNKSLSLTHLIIIVGLFVFALSTQSIASQKDGLLRVHVLDVGQGDAILIESPSGNQVLIDGGPGSGVLGELGEQMPFYDRSIDVLVLTHAHFDHLSGLIEVLNRYDVGKIVQTNIKSDSSSYKAWQAAIENEGSEVVEAIAGKEIDLGDGAVLKIIYPLESLDEKESNNPNNSSVVILLDYHDFEILLTGDLEEKGERHIVLSQVSIDADILKLGHHGSKTSTSEFFLSAVTPNIGLISLGQDNRYGHPHQVTLDRLENLGIPYYRTDVYGTITILSDGNKFNILTEK